MSLKSQLLTIIVVAYNEEEHIAQCIDSILNQNTSYDYDLIVVNDGSSDQSSEILKRYQDSAHIINTANRGPSHARNIAIAQAKTPWLMFFDADAVVDQSCVEQLLSNALKLEKEIKSSFSIGGRQLISMQAGVVEKQTADFLQALSFSSDYIHEGHSIKKVSHAPTCNVIYQKQSLLEMNGFDEKLWPCEDLDMDIRLKKRLQHQVFFCPQATIVHRRPKTYQALLGMFYRYGFGHGLLFKKHGPSQKLHMLPFLCLGFLIATSTQLTEFIKVSIGILIFNFIFWLLNRKQLKEALLFSCLLILCISVWNIAFVRALFAHKTRFGHD